MLPPENNGDAATGDGEILLSRAFTLRVLSPSAGVPGPLCFTQLSIATTVKQLKEMIRESLPSRPSDDHQRLIHRGRLLASEDETMLNIFGQDGLRTSEIQTLHLVLRNPTSDASSVQNPSNLSQQHGHPPVREPLQPARHLPHIPPIPPIPDALLQLVEEGRRLANLPPIETTRMPTPPQLQVPPPPPQPIRLPNEHAVPNHQGHIHHQHPQLMQTMQMLQQLQRDNARLLQDRHQLHATSPGTVPQQSQGHPAGRPSFQNIIAQNQRDRAALGMQGVQQQGAQQLGNTNPNGHPQSQANRVIGRPQHNTRTSTQEVTGPNGERWTVTVNETTTVLSNTNVPSFQARTAPEASSVREIQEMVQNIVSAADADAITHQQRSRQSEMNSSTNPRSSNSPNRQTNQPTSASPPKASSSRSAPLPTNSVGASLEHVVPTINELPSAPTLDGSMVYILSSPTGPRGLLVSPSENGLEAFYTPRRLVPINDPRQNLQPQNPVQIQNDAALGLPEYRNRQDGRNGFGLRHGHARAEAVAPAGPGVAHPANPPAGAVAAQMWPHIWLVVRLLGFVWFFTSGSSSWWRLYMISTVAFVIFIANLGIFNRFVERIWMPIRRRLEALLPGPRLFPLNPGAGAPARGAAGEAAGSASGAATAPTDPAQTAARLVEQRRVANENWFWTQFRRIEHATILFLASLVPGVGERHIAVRIAEANMVQQVQRLRREAAAVDAAEAAATEELARLDAATELARLTAEGEQESGDDSTTTLVEEGGQNENANRGSREESGEDHEQPLIEV